MSQRTYFDITEYVSASFLKSLKGGLPDLPNIEEIFEFGTQFHYSILEPEKVNLSYDLLWKVNEMKETFEKDDFCKSIVMHPGVKREHEFYRTIGGIKRKCKFDGIIRSLSFGFDLKSLSVTSDPQFKQAIDRFDYDLGAAWYMDIARVDKFLLIGVSKKKTSKLFKLLVNRGDEMYLRGKQKYEYCLNLI